MGILHPYYSLNLNSEEDWKYYPNANIYTSSFTLNSEEDWKNGITYSDNGTEST